MLNKIRRLVSTVKHLRSIQVFYQIKYRLTPAGTLFKGQLNKVLSHSTLRFKLTPPVEKSYIMNNEFIFLNKSKNFGSMIDWAFSGYGKLWNYNLQYCSFLLQPDLNRESKSALLLSLYNSLELGKTQLEPYPVSLRVINVIRFYCSDNLEDEQILKYLNSELEFLSERCEFHLLGNHLLENAFALFMGGAFLNSEKWSSQGKKLLTDQLGEQILSDGGHFELSPMYHQIILFRLLELIDWYRGFPEIDSIFERFIVQKATAMISWLESITFSNGDIPHFNDSTDGISYPSRWLVHYAKELNLPISFAILGASGYRALNTKCYECRIDFAQIGAPYQPGHAHADALSFILYYKGKPLIVDTGTSTYEANSVRQRERSTKAHNTVTLKNEDQSEIYGAFRVGRRAKTTIISDDGSRFHADHDGYKRTFGAVHSRIFSFLDDSITIEDNISKNIASIARFHFHPDVNVGVENGKCYVDNVGIIEFSGARDLKLSVYDFAVGFNKTVKADILAVSFEGNLKTDIYLKN